MAPRKRRKSDVVRAEQVLEELREAKYPPTEEQEAVLKAAIQGFKILVVEAGAGCGKTSQLRMLADILKALGMNGQYTAFNSPLVIESKGKFSGTCVECNTTHSLAFGSEGKRFSHRLGGRRMRSTELAEMLGISDMSIPTPGGEEGEEKRLSAAFQASAVMGAIRRFCQSADREIGEEHFKYIEGIDAPTSGGKRTYDNNNLVRMELLPYAQAAWEDLTNPDGMLPFQHDHYVKMWQLNKPRIHADMILVDEAQDLSPVMLDVLRQQKAPVILVGDSAQQIYEWRGAVNALAAFKDAERLMLSQSFRFGEAIANLANKVLETLEEPVSLRLKGLPSIDSKIGVIPKPHAILCRTNAAAISNLLGALDAGKKAFLVGGGADVVRFVEAAQALKEGKSTSHPELACFNSWAEVKQYVEEDEEGEDLKLMVKMIDDFGAKTIKDALLSMPEEDESDLVISTAHKSKGREWDSVVLARDFPPVNKCGDPEKRLVYVAVTRARLQLDVSQCPFFTGDEDDEESEDYGLGVPSWYELPALEKPVADKEEEEPQEEVDDSPFTWSRDRANDCWLVRGARGKKSGDKVVVSRRDGSSSVKVIRSLVSEGSDWALYKV